jgi:hypothetical protein
VSDGVNITLDEVYSSTKEVDEGDSSLQKPLTAGIMVGLLPASNLRIKSNQ